MYSDNILIDVENSTLLQIAKIWILADQWCMPRLQNLAIDRLSREAERTKGVSGYLAAHVYDNVYDPSPLRKFIVAMGVYNMPSRIFHDGRDIYPIEYLQDVCFLFFSRREKQAVYDNDYEPFFERDPTTYHVNDGSKNRKLDDREEEELDI